MGLYSSVVRPLAFRLEAERAHHLAIKLGASMAWAAPSLTPLLAVSEPSLGTTVAGLRFPHPIGLAAGYDKSGESEAMQPLIAALPGFIYLPSDSSLIERAATIVELARPAGIPVISATEGPIQGPKMRGRLSMGSSSGVSEDDPSPPSG
jgi:hypothetical protein